MKVIIAGSRYYKPTDLELDHTLEESGFDIYLLVCGMAPGVDQAALRWARKRDIPWSPFYADWSKHGKAAGPIRNREMAQLADALIAFRLDGGTKGTDNMIYEAKLENLPIHIVNVRTRSWM